MGRKLTACIAGLVFVVGALVGCGPDAGTTAAAPTAVASAGAPTALPATAQPSPAPTETPEPTVVPTPEGPQATVIDLVNEVDAHALAASPWEPAEVAMPIYLTGEVWAKEASTARVGLASAVIRVAPNTIFTHRASDADSVQLKLDEGQLWINVEGLEPDETFEVETPNGIASVRGTRFGVRVAEDGATLVSTQVGTVTLSTASGVVTVTAATQSLVPSGGTPEPAGPMTVEEQLRWGMAAVDTLDVVLPVSGEVVTVTQPGYVSVARVSPDGRYLSYFYYNRVNEVSTYGTRIFDLVANDFVQTDSLDYTDGFSFNPNGDKVAYVTLGHAEDEICTAPVGDWDAASCFSGAVNYGWPRWTPDGAWLYFYAQMDSDTAPWYLYQARPDGSELTVLNVDMELSAFDPTWSADGAWLAYSAQAPLDFDLPGYVWVVNPDKTDVRRVFEGSYAHHGLAWSPDSTTLAIRGAETGLYLYDVALDAVQPVTGTEGLPCLGAIWSPTATGWPLLFQTYDPETLAPGPLNAVGADGTWTTLADVTWGPQWFPDGSGVVFGAQRLVDEAPTTTIYVAKSQPDFYP